MRNQLIILFFCLFTFAALKANAQQMAFTDSSVHIPAADTALEKIPLRYQNCRRRSPVLAGILAYCLPFGGGQIYNKQYGKAGIIFGVEFVSIIGIVGTASDHQFKSNSTTSFFIAILIADVVYELVDAPLSAIYLNEKYHLKRRKQSYTSLRISPNLINAGAGNKYDAGISVILR